VGTEYGLTPQGPNIKRLDTIIDEIHNDLSEGWKVNTRLNPQSLLNVQVVAFADKIAELWELGQEIYHATYPWSAENADLDNAVQFGGISRENAQPTIYPIHCKCVEGAAIPQGTRIRTNTNPAMEFLARVSSIVSRGAFNQAQVRVVAVQAPGIYTIVLNGNAYSYTAETSDPVNGSVTEAQILEGLVAAVTDLDFLLTIVDNLLLVESLDLQRTHNMILSANLTTETVTSILHFASELKGEIALPNGTITEIVTSVPGLIAVVNLIPYIAGRLRETDVELRQSYADKIFHRSNRMLESIKSAILLNVQGVNSVAAFQNDTNITDAYGRWPHSIEVVADGGSDYEIALQIRDRKAGGIQTFGSVEVVVPGEEGEPMVERFNRPEYVYVWYRLALQLNPSEILPPNYVTTITQIILDAMRTVIPGQSIVPQRLIEARIYGTVPGIGFIETRTFSNTDPNETPNPLQYVAGPVAITPRQRAVTQDTRIEVVLGG